MEQTGYWWARRRSTKLDRTFLQRFWRRVRSRLSFLVGFLRRLVAVPVGIVLFAHLVVCLWIG